MTAVIPRILVVEDNESILYNLILMLNMNGFEPIGAKNGQEAFDLMNSLNPLPDLIISDIMMPLLNGYDLYLKISKNPIWHLIPFIFLTAKSSPDDIRFGKKLGVDDYITKPFKEEDLIASIKGKLTRSQQNLLLATQFKKELINIQSKESIQKHLLSNCILFWVRWDDVFGPALVGTYPKTLNNAQFSIDEISAQLFNAASALYGQKEKYNATDILLHLENIHQDAYLYFDSILDQSIRGGSQLFMIGVLADAINYLESQRLKEIVRVAANNIKGHQTLLLQNVWEEIGTMLK